MLMFFFHFALDGQKTELFFRCIDSQRGAALGRQKFYADGIGRDV